ncbi:hypothetical protein [Pseudomonas sp. NyZ201]|uniref:hypothetical protein n=1 Tax=Pseudomonas sp. NyZ201 TaxID=3409857 RepID=UPI003CFAD7E6
MKRAEATKVTRQPHGKDRPVPAKGKRAACVADTGKASVQPPKPAVPMMESAPKGDKFHHLVVAATKGSLERLPKDAASQFAYAFWYENDAMCESVEKRLNTPGLPQVRKRRLMYLVDRLRRFPCLTPEQASRMKDFVSRWSKLSQDVSRKVSKRAAATNPYDKLAATWGLEEKVSHVMNMVLELQTRHFVDEHNLPSGYSKLEKH